jgi:hypothetical protein
LKLTQVLTSGRSYYWRAKAQDGANEGPFSAAATFEIVTPVVFEAPGLVGPHHTGTLTSMTPVFTWHNAARTGTPNGTVVYELQVSETSAFATNLGTSVNEAPAAQTSVTVSEGLKASTQYFWRVRARDSIVTGPWSGVAIFTTPFAGGGSGGGGGGGGGAGPVNNACHVGPGPLSRDRANAIVLGCAEEFPHLIAVFSTEDEAVAKAEELLLRTIWHLQLAGFNAARQRNPSQAISKDKLSLLLDGVWHAYDIFTLGYAGVATRVGGMLEVPLPNPVPDPGIPD